MKLILIFSLIFTLSPLALAAPRLSEVLGHAENDRPKGLLKDLKECIKKCEKEDRKAAQLILIGMTSLQKYKGKDVTTLSKTQKKQAEKAAAKLHYGFVLNVKNQTEPAEQLIALVHYLNSYNPKKTGIQKELAVINKAFKSVFKKMPDNSDAYYWYGIFLSRQPNPNRQAIAKAFDHCLKINPYEEKCRLPEVAQCGPKDMEEDFAMRSVSRTEENGYMVYKEKDRPKPIYIDPHTVISKEDIAVVQDGPSFLSIELTPKGAHKFSRFTRDHVGQEMALFYGDDLISNARITQEIKDGHLQLTPGADNKEGLFEKICKKESP